MKPGCSWWSAALAALLFVGCTDDPEPGGAGGSGGGDAAMAECEEDARRCAGDAVELCRGGVWTALADCPGAQFCEDGECVEPVCEPDCADRECGDDGCGGDCGPCADGGVCVAGACEDAPAACGDGACQDDEDCANCPADCGCPEGEVCDAPSRACAPACVPDCEGRICGSDGCDGVCGACDDEQLCMDGACVDAPPECGDGVCEEGESCLGCPLDCGVCCGDGACVPEHGEDCATCLADCFCADDARCDVPTRACVPACTPDCEDRACGDDGCDGVCGACAGDLICDADGACVEPPAECGDGACADGEDCANCPADCGQCCGDGQCGAGENCATCPVDCGCPDGEFCDLDARACAPEECAPQCQGRVCGPDGCGDVCGVCDAGELCDPDRGRCEAQCEPQCADRACGPDGCGGTCGDCGPDEDCDAGQCVPACVPVCNARECGPDGCGGLCGACADGEACGADGQCLGGGLACDCAADEICLDGVCRQPELICGEDTPEGLCANGEDCVAGVCVDAGAGCSVDNPGGVCPAGLLCVGGACEAFDDVALCDDRNACTADAFDFARNACVNPAIEGPCTDGNGCTADRCLDGVCVSDPIPGCIPPPTIDPYVTPTNEVELRLSGTKPAGAAVTINGEVAAPESPEEMWAVTLNLVPGENVYVVRSLDQGQESEAVEVRVVYDITPPNTTITPDGGVYLDGLTVTIATDEPATVYYTTDGSSPDEHSDHFFSVRTMRIFDDTTLRVRALDEAGNWEEAPQTAVFEITGERNRWHVGAPLAEALIHAAVSQHDDGIYVVGGSDGQAAQAGISVFAPAEEAWMNLPALPLARSQAASINDGALYVFGGENEGLPLNLVSRLTAGADGWENRRPMPSTRFGLRAVHRGARVYVLGGKTNGGVVVDTHEVYDLRTDTWSNDVAQMPRPRYAFATVLVDDDIFVVGGEDEDGNPIAEVDVYDIGADAWRQIDPLPTPRSFLGATLEINRGAVTGGHTGIIVSGGRGAGGQPTAVVEEYIVEEARWVARSPLPRPRHGAGAATIVRADALDSQRGEGWLIGGQLGGEGLAGDALTASTAYYTHVQDHIRHLAPLPAGRFMHAAVSLGDRIYLLGGREFQETTQGWAFDPETGTYDAIADLPSAQNGLAAVALDGRVWAIGGANAFGLALPTLRSYDPVLDAWTDHRPMLNGRRDAVAVVIGGEIHVVGGDNNGPVQAVEIYDPLTDRWRNGPLLPEARAGAVGVAWQGRLFIAGGRNADGVIHGNLLELRDGRWLSTQVGAFPVADAVAGLIGSRLIVMGGRQVGDALTDRHSTFDLDRRRMDRAWTPATRLLLPYDHAAAVTHNGEIYVFGGNTGTPPGPSGLAEVQKFAGRCLDGALGRYEGGDAFLNTADFGGGCGAGDFTVALPPNDGYGNHGGCNTFNACGDARTCAHWACQYRGHGPAVSWREGVCTRDRTCHLFRGNPNDIQLNWPRSCDIPVAYQIVCQDNG